jgi:hypothetical protein
MRKRFWITLFALLAAAFGSQPTIAANTSHPQSDLKPVTPLLRSANETAPIAIQNDLRRIAVALETANTANESPEEKKNVADNLRYQQRMATSAERMFWVGLFESAITLLGVILVGLTLRATRQAVREAKRAADAAEETLKEARESSDQELRAYISVEPHGVNQMIASANAKGQVTVRNVGKIPAQHVSVTVDVFISSDETAPMPEYRPDGQKVARAIQPSSGMIQGSGNELSLTEIYQANKYVYVWGAVRYDDGLSKTRRTTYFCHRYPTAARDRSIDPHSRADATRAVIDTGKARYHVYGNDSD